MFPTRPSPLILDSAPWRVTVGLVAAAETITITTQEPLAHVRSEFDATNIRLGDLETVSETY